MKIGVSGSPAVGSRNTDTRVTPTSSSAQPVTDSAPETPVVFSPGVSMNPNAAAVNGPACVTVTRPPPIDKVVVRVLIVGLGSTVNVSVASPDPLVARRCTHGASLEATHAHGVRSAIDALPPSRGEEL
jgi:hypothetical protein